MPSFTRTENILVTMCVLATISFFFHDAIGAKMGALQRQWETQTSTVDSAQTQGAQQNFGSNEARQQQMLLNQITVSSSAFEDQGLRAEVFEKGLQAFKAAVSNGDTRSLIFTIIDFELPSTQKRLWVIDLQAGKLLHNEQVTHGRGSDKNHDGKVDGAGAFSNNDGSYQSNIGLLRTAETYHSSKFNGTAMRMDGLEKGFNDHARDRAIVMHPADYANRSEGQIMGRSQGCPALDPDVSGKVIQTIKGGTLIFQYYPDPNWLSKSKYLQQ